MAVQRVVLQPEGRSRGILSFLVVKRAVVGLQSGVCRAQPLSALVEAKPREASLALCPYQAAEGHSK